VHNLEIGTQFPDSENAQRNLEIVQIPRLHRIFIFQVVCQRIRLYAESHLNIWLALLHKLTKVNNEWGCSAVTNLTVQWLEAVLSTWQHQNLKIKTTS